MCDERKMKAGSFSLSDTVIGWFGGGGLDQQGVWTADAE